MQHTKTKHQKATRHYIENRIKQDTQLTTKPQQPYRLALCGLGVALILGLVLILHYRA